MFPRPGLPAVLAALLVLGSPLAAKDKASAPSVPAPEARTWTTVVDYVLKNGGDKAIRGPSNKLLGLTSDDLPAKALRVKSVAAKDKREHSVHVGYSKAKNGKLIATTLLIGIVKVTSTDNGRSVDGYKIRLSTSGSMLSMMRAAGPVGSVKQNVIAVDSKEAKTILKAEESFYLSDLKFQHLTE